MLKRTLSKTKILLVDPHATSPHPVELAYPDEKRQKITTVDFLSDEVRSHCSFSKPSVSASLDVSTKSIKVGVESDAIFFSVELLLKPILDRVDMSLECCKSPKHTFQSIRLTKQSSSFELAIPTIERQENKSLKAWLRNELVMSCRYSGANVHRLKNGRVCAIYTSECKFLNSVLQVSLKDITLSSNTVCEIAFDALYKRMERVLELSSDDTVDTIFPVSRVDELKSGDEPWQLRFLNTSRCVIVDVLMPGDDFVEDAEMLVPVVKLFSAG